MAGGLVVTIALRGFCYQPFVVVRKALVTPRMMRITFGGAAIANLSSPGWDDDIRIIMPEDAAQDIATPVVHWNPYRLDEPAGAPASFTRAYTVRRFRPEQAELDIDFALHGHGAAATWAGTVEAGRIVAIGGPFRAHAVDPSLTTHLYVGDESALPGIGRALEQLPAGVTATAVIEVEAAAEEQIVAATASTNIVWVHRRGGRPGDPARLLGSLRALGPQPATTFAYAAGESHVTRAVRRFFREELGLPKEQIYAAGYWRRDDHAEELGVVEEE